MDGDDRRYFIVVNDEEQYSIWDPTRPPQSGWTAMGEAASKEACERLWTDLCPKSVREAGERA